MNHLGKAVPETVRQLYNMEQVPQNDMTGGDFVIAKLLGGKGLPNKGWEEMKPEVTQKINKIADNMTQYAQQINNINEANGSHFRNVINKS
ncbi:hypothetical protein H6G97_13835 [Nostoc flagelliforme FACHB-838]|uniref:Uncharacterized protein n=2 Tax=Nostoc flagelliforme TaxID=1306274 RepID=A0ABR8DPY7_9NOSO|nr:hypothetical protein [Nostoc flagelliforme FACHB-838]